jgi:hypothetical protein
MVDFPLPLAPTIAVNFPAGIDREIFFNTVTTINVNKKGENLQDEKDK